MNSLFLVHCVGYFGHHLYETQTYQNVDNFGHSCCICHLFSSLWHDLHMNSFCLISQYCFDNALATAGMYSSYSCVLQIYTQLYHIIIICTAACCTHIHISLILLCLYCHELSFLSFHSDHLHEDVIVSVLQLVEWMAYFIICFFVYMRLSLHVCYLHNFFVFVYLSFPSMEYVIFSISTIAFFEEISAKL